MNPTDCHLSYIYTTQAMRLASQVVRDVAPQGLEEISGDRTPGAFALRLEEFRP